MSKAIVNMTPNPSDIQTIHCSQGDTEAREWEFELHNNGEVIDAGGITEQMVFKSYKGGTEQILPENGAVPVTAPFVGDIKYHDVTRNDQEFLYRQSPTEEDGNANIKSLYGNTLVWNQHSDTITPGTASKGLTMSRKTGVDIPTIHIEGTYNYESGQDINFYVGWAVSRPKFAVGHKILVLTTMKNFGVGTYTATPLTYGGERAILVTITQDNYLNLLFRCKLPNGSVINEDFTVNVFDLTQMGLDSITSVDEFTALFPKSYYDYCKGAMLSFGGRNVKFNQLNQNGNFESTSGMSTWGCTISASNNVLTFKATTNTGNCANPYMNLVNGHKYLITVTIQKENANEAIKYGIEYGWRKTFQADNVSTKKTYNQIVESTYTGQAKLYIADLSGTSFTDYANVYVSNYQCFDLSEMFGVGNEPSAEGFKELFPNDYYEYNVGQYMNLGQPVSLKTTGFNQWDEVWEHGSLGNNGENTGSSASPEIRSTNYIPIVQNASYYLNVPAVAVVHYYGSADLSNYKGNQYIASAQLLNIPNGTNYIRFRTIGSYGDYKNDICLNISDPNRNGTYEPYTENTLSIPLNEFPNGMDGINDVRDEKSETKYVKRIGQITFDGTQTMVGQDISSSVCKAYYEVTNIQPKTYGSAEIDNDLISNYLLPNSNTNTNSGASGIHRRIGGQGQICVSLGTSSGVTTVDAFNAYLSSHPLTVLYPLATPLENYGILNLGDCTWSYAGGGTSNARFVGDLLTDAVFPASGNTVANVICDKYKTVTESQVYNNQKVGICITTTGRIMVYDPSHTDATAFKQAMQGVYLLYEKQNPQGFTTATLVTENGEVALANENGVLVGKCNSDVSADAGFIEGKIKLSDEDGDVYSNKIQIHVERMPE